MRTFALAFACLLVGLPELQVTRTQGAYARFDSVTDTIRLDGNTVVGSEITIEARIRITPDSGNWGFTLPGDSNGRIFQEQFDGAEDKSLSVNSEGGMTGAAYIGDSYIPLGLGGTQAEQVVPIGQWQTIAFVRDTVSMRLYVDGQEVHEELIPTNLPDIQNSTLSSMTIGCFKSPTADFMRYGFIGDLDWLRVMDTALSFPRLDGRGGSIDQATWCCCSQVAGLW